MIRAGLVLALALVAALAWQANRLDAVRADLVAARAQVAGLQELDKFRVKQQAAAQEAAAMDQEFSKGVGADVPLSDYLRKSVGRVWP